MDCCTISEEKVETLNKQILSCTATLGGGEATSAWCWAEEATHFTALHWPQPVRELHDPLQPLHELLREREEPALLHLVFTIVSGDPLKFLMFATNLVCAAVHDEL